MSSLKEPVSGWTDNIYGPTGLLIGGGKGLLRVSYCNKHISQNSIPIDIVIKAILVVTWKLGLTTYDYQHIFACSLILNYECEGFPSLFRTNSIHCL